MNSLDFRRDERSIEQFSKNIKDFTEREMHWGVILRHDFIDKDRPCHIEDYGVDNQGRVILGRLPNSNVDKIFHFLDGKKIYIEIKTVPEYSKSFTFKVSSLKNCVKQNAFLIVPRSWTYYIFYPETCDYLQKNYSHEIYQNFSKNDLAVRIFQDQIKDLILEKKISQQPWTKTAKNLIKTNYKLLFRDKNEFRSRS